MRSLIFAFLLGLTQASLDWDNVIPVRSVVRPPPNVVIPELIPRIAGGHEAEPNSIPYQVALFINTTRGTHFCGGSLISEDYVLTAAHCINDASIRDIKVILGAHAVKAEEETQQIIISTEFKRHEEYSSSKQLHDIGVIKLSTPAILNDFVQVVTLSNVENESNFLEGVTAEVSGWGKTWDGDTAIAEKLHVVESDIISNQACDEWYFSQDIIQPSHICLNGDKLKSPCSGDSGGPLMYEGKQIGIVSFGIMFGCQVGWPAAFTRVSSYTDWIIENAHLNS